ncbi:hypothetical protein [Tenacibaculum sp. 190524A02b]|uniref:hypothetical protein n=1 Tax=Tenacibaculum vairaonense TaxID=3137860 RepID=UPI0031FB66C1
MKKLPLQKNKTELFFNKFQISKIENPHTIFGGRGGVGGLHGFNEDDDDDDTEDPTQSGFVK